MAWELATDEERLRNLSFCLIVLKRSVGGDVGLTQAGPKAGEWPSVSTPGCRRNVAGRGATGQMALAHNDLPLRSPAFWKPHREYSFGTMVPRGVWGGEPASEGVGCIMTFHMGSPKVPSHTQWAPMVTGCKIF